MIVAGSDSGGGAGIQADIKTVTALGGYAATAVTARTAQNTEGVFGIVGVEPDFIAQQMELVLSDIGADAVKIGMLHNAAVIEAVADVLESEESDLPLVIDPVMVAKGGAPLLDPQATATLKRRLPNMATVMTPNLPEAEVLSGMTIQSFEEMVHAAQNLLTLGTKAVVLKGGHMEGEKVIDLLATQSGVELFESARIDTMHTHGTGCTLSSAIATGLAQGLTLSKSLERARAYVYEAIRTAPGFGRGHGPLNHAHRVPPYPLDD